MKSKSNHIKIENSKIKNSVLITDFHIEENGELDIKSTVIERKGDISFSRLDGKIHLKNLMLSKTKFDFDILKEKDYEPLIIKEGKKIDFDLTISNLREAHILAEENKENTYKLDLEYLEKKYIRKRKITLGPSEKLASILGLLPQYILGYFCKWHYTLCSSIIIMLIFSILYYFNPADFSLDKYKGADGCTVSESKDFHLLAASFYFSAITFTTVGYGDYTPVKEGYMKLIPALEGIIGVLMIAFLSVSIVRRYIK